MKISMTGRHLEVTPSLREYAEKRISRLEKYFHQLIDIGVIMSVEKLDHVVELLVNGDGVQFHAIEKAGDMYSSIDLLVDKMEKQIVKFKEKHTGHKVVPLRMIETIEAGERGGMEIALNQVSNKPKDEVEAYLEMKLEGRDFILFKKGVKDVGSTTDYANKNYAVLYRDGKELRLVEIPLEMIRSNRYDAEGFVVNEVRVENDSPANPRLRLRAVKKGDMPERLTVGEALERLLDSKKAFLPFFNNETSYLNVIYRNGKNYEIMVPAF